MPSMQAAMDLFLSSAMYAVHTSLPAKVEKYDAEKHTATVKPAVNMLMDNGVQIEIPSLMEVPVVFPASKFFDLEFPLDEGDGVLLLFQESDISTWKNGDFPAIPAVASRFNLDSATDTEHSPFFHIKYEAYFALENPEWNWINIFAEEETFMAVCADSEEEAWDNYMNFMKVYMDLD